MQTTKTAWLLVFAVAACSIPMACTITTSDGGNMGGSDTGGTSVTTGGASSGGASKGGATSGGVAATGGASSGGAATGGASTSGGASTATGGAAEMVSCDDTSTTPMGTPAGSCEFAPADNTFCHACLTTQCCAIVKQCFGTGPLDQCAFGGPDGSSEFQAYEACIVKRAKAAGGAYDPDVDPFECAAEAGTPSCGGLIGNATSDLIGCMHDHCETECFVDPAKP